jgi:hypothetical protein
MVASPEVVLAWKYVLQDPQRFFLTLPGAFSRDVQLLADYLKRALFCLLQTKTLLNDDPCPLVTFSTEDSLSSEKNRREDLLGGCIR